MPDSSCFLLLHQSTNFYLLFLPKTPSWADLFVTQKSYSLSAFFSSFLMANASGPPNSGCWLQEDCPQSTEDSVLETVLHFLVSIHPFKGTPLLINHEFHELSSTSSHAHNSVSLISKWTGRDWIHKKILSFKTCHKWLNSNVKWYLNVSKISRWSSCSCCKVHASTSHSALVDDQE